MTATSRWSVTSPLRIAGLRCCACRGEDLMAVRPGSPAPQTAEIHQIKDGKTRRRYKPRAEPTVAWCRSCWVSIFAVRRDDGASEARA